MIPVSYNYRNLLVRWRTTLMTACGFTLVVMALVLMLAFVNGVRTVCAESGQPENVMALKEGNFDEVLSHLDIETIRKVETTPGLLSAADGMPLSSRELFMSITQWDDRDKSYHALQARGVYPVALEVHTQVRIVEGRMFRPNHRELILGRGTARQERYEVGDTMPLGQLTWDIVGIFEADGSAFESEAWGDIRQLAGHFHREGVYSSVVFRTASPDAAAEAVDYLKNNRMVPVQVQTETEYYEKQAEQTEPIRIGAIVIAVFMAIGAVFGITNTMFAAIGERTKDIAVMRLLGFGKGEILVSFLLEALLIAVAGGVLGSLLGYAVNGWTLSTALGGKQVAFAFEVDALTLGVGAAFALTMGVIGGILPAMSAMQVDPLETMR